MKADREYESVTIDKIETHADGYTLVRSDGFCFMCPLIPDGYIPVVGDEARFYGQGIGLPVRGLVINGHTAFYRTPEEQEAKHREEREADGCAPLDDEPLRLIRRLAARLRTALADVARLTEENAALRSEVEAIGASYDRARLAAEQARAAAEAAVKEAQRDDVLFTAFVFGFLRRDLEKRSCLPPPEWYSEDSMIAMILEAIRARAEKE